jgi:hypothetical protein
MSEQPALSLRTGKAGANHHLWKNNGTWWVHLTFHLPGLLKHRLRTSLETSDLGRARCLRDSLLVLYGINPRSL